MSDEKHPELIDVAGAVADRAAVDWDGRAAAHPGLGSTLERLHTIERIAEAHAEAAAREEAAAPAPPAGVPEFTWGPLEVFARIGAGSFGEVYRAWEPALARAVALKLGPRGDETAPGARRWLDEARRLARVRHPHVLAVFGAAVHDGRAGLWTELIVGETLEERLARDGPIGAREAALVGVDLCAALAAVHASGIAHGDVKAANVIREGAVARADDATGMRPGRIVLMDFGAARALASGDDVCATPIAAAPETLDGAPPDARADVYALGALLFRLVTGRHPVEGNTVAAIREAHHRGDRPALRTLRPDLPAEFVATVERALERDPARRFAGAAAMERALAASLGAPPRRMARLAIAFAAVLVVAALAAVLVFRVRAPRAPGPGPAPTDRATADTGREAAPGVTTAPDAHTGERATTPAALAIEATLLRRRDGAVESLDEGGRVSLGDRLALEVRSREPVWLYVLNEDQSGARFALFPLEQLDTTNPLGPDAIHLLPGPREGRVQSWRVSSAAGAETFLVVAARHRLPALEREVVALAAAPAPGAAPDSAALAMRGVGEIADDGPWPSGRDGYLDRLARRLAGADDPGVWIKTVRIAHEGP